MTRGKLMDRMKLALAGSIATRVVLGEETNFAIADIKRVTRMAHKYVFLYGMSDIGITCWAAQPYSTDFLVSMQRSRKVVSQDAMDEFADMPTRNEDFRFDPPSPSDVTWHRWALTSRVHVVHGRGGGGGPSPLPPGSGPKLRDCGLQAPAQLLKLKQRKARHPTGPIPSSPCVGQACCLPLRPHPSTRESPPSSLECPAPCARAPVLSWSGLRRYSDEVRRVVKECYEEVWGILLSRKDALWAGVGELREKKELLG